ncbi:hypothetical protein QN277_016739 [Acacia crassicarpa]|uniref:Uncharacterized protein n=1 Tax=Acacia crassicarpa TaxID=499986 RepID=A0AAE1MX79_9FABA|nr:hypothetical protein QN277_016739 [Acacia crassicarpa]
MPSRSSSRKKSNRHLKKPNSNTNKPFTSHPNRHSSPALQSQDKLDLNILREQNGQNGNCPVKKPNSGSVEEARKVLEEAESEDKQVVGLDEEKVKTIVESEAARVLAETQQVEEEQDSITVSSLVEPEKIRDASELIVDDIKELEAELKQKSNQEQDSQETETSREAEAAVDEATTTEADDADKLDSSEEKKESSSIETNETLLISESSVPQTDLASRAIEETTPIVKPEESGETKLPGEEQKVEESTVVKESSKEEEEEAKESLPPSDVAAAETTSTTMQEKTEITAGTESQQTTVNQAPREYSSWSSCCGIFDFLSR